MTHTNPLCSDDCALLSCRCACHRPKLPEPLYSYTDLPRKPYVHENAFHAGPNKSHRGWNWPLMGSFAVSATIWASILWLIWYELTR